MSKNRKMQMMMNFHFKRIYLHRQIEMPSIDKLYGLCCTEYYFY